MKALRLNYSTILVTEEAEVPELVRMLMRTRIANTRYSATGGDLITKLNDIDIHITEAIFKEEELSDESPAS